MNTNPRISLRPIISTDHHDIFRGLSDPDVVKFYGVSFKTLEATLEQMTWFRDLEKNETGKWWTVRDAVTSEFLGAGGFNDLDKQLKKAEIGFWLLPEFWGQGYMQEAMPLICNYGFNELGLQRIEGFVASENLKCKKALEKLGFTFKGTTKDFELKKGEFAMVDTYIKLKEEMV